MAKIQRYLVNELGVLWVLSIASITDAVSCDDVISVTLPSSYTVHSGQDVTLQCTFTPMSEDISRYQVRWQRNAQEYEVVFTSGRITTVLQPAWNERLSFQSAASVVISGVTAADAGTYTCGVKITLTDPVLCDKANTRYFTKSTILSVLVPVGGVSVTRSRATGHDVTMGDTVYLSCTTSSGSTPITYTWLLNNAVLRQTGRELTISNIQPNQAGPYTCNASNTVSWQQSRTFTFNVLLPVRGVSVTRSRATGHDVTNGDSAYLSCITASGTTPITYTWVLNNTPLQQIGRELAIINIQPNQAGPYSCNVSNSISWQQSGTFTFNVLLPVRGVSVTRLRATGHDVTNGDTAYLSCIIASGTPPITYAWLLNNTLLQQTGRELTISNVQPHQAGPYTCNASNTISWQQSGTFTFNVLLPVRGVSVTRSRATGHDVTKGDTAYLSCITASGTTPITYTWLLNNAALQQTGRELAISNIQPNQAGPYSCNVSNSISWQQSGTFTFNVLLPVGGVFVTRSRATGHDVTKGDTAYLNCTTTLGFAPRTYTWLLNNAPLQQTGRKLIISNIQPNQAGPYSCNVSNSISWQQSSTFTFNVLYAPENWQNIPTLTGYNATSDKLVTGETSVTLACRAPGGNPLASLSWTSGCPSGTSSDHSTSDTSEIRLQFTVQTSHHQTTCGCNATHAQGVPDSRERQVTFLVIHPPSSVSIIPSPSLPWLSTGQNPTTNAQLSCSATGGYPTSTLSWQRNSVSVPGSVTYIFQTADISENQVEYKCLASNEYTTTKGVIVQKAIRLDVQYHPIVQVSVSPSSTRKVNESVTLICTAHGNPTVTSYRWQKGGWTTGQANHTIQQLTKDDSGQYTCTVTANSARHGDLISTKYITLTVQSPTDQTNGTGIIVSIVVPIALVIIAIVIAILICKIRSVKRKKDGPNAQIANAVRMDDMKVSEESPYIDLLQRDVEIPRGNIKTLEQISKGAFVLVLKGSVFNMFGKKKWTTVAIKTSKDEKDAVVIRDLMNELKVMMELSAHPNVVSLLGSCTRDGGAPMIITEYLSNGDLQTFLRNDRSQNKTVYSNLHGNSLSLTSRDLIKCALDVARGMAYLSSSAILHRDLAARNIFVSEDKTCKISDFGFAKDVIESHQYERKSEGRLPVRWMSPEALYDNIYTTQSDVWAYGVLLWEIVTLGFSPYPGMSAKQVMEAITEGYRMPQPPHCSLDMYSIMLSCWEVNPRSRPTFQSLTDTLSHLLSANYEVLFLGKFEERLYEELDYCKPDEKC